MGNKRHIIHIIRLHAFRAARRCFDRGTLCKKSG